MIYKIVLPSLTLIILLLIIGCEKKSKKTSDLKTNKSKAPEGMVWISGGVYERGAVFNDTQARDDERPQHSVKINGFWMDITEVTNKEFKTFVEATGYITTAEKALDWEQLKQQLPQGTEKPHDSILKPGSLSFHCKKNDIQNLNDYSQWWEWRIGANWRHPKGKDSSIEGKDNFPVVHVSFDDAKAYCKWAKRRLPTEAEWEYAARGGIKDQIFTWGNEKNKLNLNANTWQGDFPNINTNQDGFEGLSPVKSFPKNLFGLYDMAGNVWEWTQDWYDYEYYKTFNNIKLAVNPTGPNRSRNFNNPLAQEKVIRGGSYLCHESYCSSYRVSARMGTSYDTGLEHLGFRTVLSPK